MGNSKTAGAFFSRLFLDKENRLLEHKSLNLKLPTLNLEVTVVVGNSHILAEDYSCSGLNLWCLMPGPQQ